MAALVGCKFVCKCNWEFDGDVRRSLSFGNKTEKPNGETELSELVQLETCIQLFKPNEDIPCTLSISLEDSSLQIIKVSIVSEARNVEIYGLYDEYMTTIKAENLDDFEGIVVNLAESAITPVHEIMLKFAGLKDPNSMWLFGVRLTVDSSLGLGKGGGGPSKVNYEAVEERLKTARVPITEKAERCKQFLRQYTEVTTSCAVGGRPPDPATFLHLMEEAQLRSGSSDFDRKLPIAQKDVQGLKLYIDSSIEKLEGRLTKYLDDRLRQLEMCQNNKLDEIIVMMKDSLLRPKSRTPCSCLVND